MSEEIILNRIEKGIHQQVENIIMYDRLIKGSKYEQDIKLFKRNKYDAENILYILQGLKKYKNVPLKRDYLNKSK